MFMTHYEASVVSLKMIFVGVEPENGDLTVCHQETPTPTERSFYMPMLKSLVSKMKSHFKTGG